MSTNARIGIKLEDGSILSAYHHWDGYPEWLGVVLKTRFETKEKVAELIDGGNMSSCWSDNEFDYEKQEFVKRDPQPEYYGGDDEAPRLSKNFTQFAFDSKSVFKSKISACKIIASSNLSKFNFVLADISTIKVSPDKSSAINSCSNN